MTAAIGVKQREKEEKKRMSSRDKQFCFRMITILLLNHSLLIWKEREKHRDKETEKKTTTRITRTVKIRSCFFFRRIITNLDNLIRYVFF